MANDKLIDYTGLGNFREDLVNDGKTSIMSTWSSRKITDKIDDLYVKKVVKHDIGQLTITLSSNTLYYFEDRTSDLNILLADEIPDILNEYHLIIKTGNTRPNIDWPNNLSWEDESKPFMSPNKTYEVSILNNIALYIEI